MRIAQRLYEEGLITYMRTDSPNLSQEAITAARTCVEQLYGQDYLSPQPRQFTSKAKGAQEAHEAIRPAGGAFVHPKDTGLSGKELALYELIWKRTVASQMAEAKKKSVVAKLSCAGAVFTASGTRILFPGFLRAYVEGSDDPEAALEDKEVSLPALVVGDSIKCEKLEALSHETKPPARFSEAALVQALEKAGVGRPSTYASIIGTISERGYVRKQGNALVPTFTGFAVIQLLEKNFERLVDLGFTSKMEESLDEIAAGQLEWLPYLKGFYSGAGGLRAQVQEQEKRIDPNESRCVDLPHLKGIQVKIGRFGPYVVLPADRNKSESGDSSTELHASIPEDVAPADLSEEKTQELLAIQARGPQPLGTDPRSGKGIYVLVGRFGPYVQLGQVSDDEKKPRRASIPKGVDPKAVTVEMALEYLSLPRDLGLHPVSGKPIQANLGRFGPYVVHEKDFRSLKKEDNVYTVTLERALALLAEEKKASRSRAVTLRELGEHPKDKKPVTVLDGKYGPYVKHGETNASLPKDLPVEALTMEKAVELLDARKSR
jgi:DNA topoisomerase-1